MLTIIDTLTLTDTLHGAFRCDYARRVRLTTLLCSTHRECRIAKEIELYYCGKLLIVEMPIIILEETFACVEQSLTCSRSIKNIFDKDIDQTVGVIYRVTIVTEGDTR